MSLLSSSLCLLLVFCAPLARPMWASCTLCVHVFYIYTMLAFDEWKQDRVTWALASLPSARRLATAAGAPT